MLLAAVLLAGGGLGWQAAPMVASSPAAVVERQPAAALLVKAGVGGDGRLLVGSAGSESSAQLIDKEMLALLKKARLEGADVSVMPRALAGRMPQRIGGLDGEDRKKLFIDVLLPTVMTALDEVRQERRQLLSILAELGGKTSELTLAADQDDWQRRLSPDKVAFIRTLTAKYQTASAAELVVMVDVLPPSLILAQGALESSWGGSHYALEANNLFGMYASDDRPLANGRPPKIMAFRSILDSVRAYVLNINRSSAYRELRRIRSYTLDPMRIADGLTEYSERRQFYIAELKQVITLNRLRHYDSLLLATG